MGGQCDVERGCASAAGCHGRKDDQARLISDTIAAMYPTRRWGEPDDARRFHAGVPATLGQKIARAATRELRAPAYFRSGAEDDLCDFVWVLCVGREPALLDVVQGRAAMEPGAGPIEDCYLRVALSSLVRAATIQEIRIAATPVGASLYELREATRDGVYDPVLLKRLQKLVELVTRAGLSYFDFGMLCEDSPAEPEIDFSAYVERYGATPSALALLFYPRPPVTVSTVLVPAS